MLLAGIQLSVNKNNLLFESGKLVIFNRTIYFEIFFTVSRHLRFLSFAHILQVLVGICFNAVKLENISEHLKVTKNHRYRKR